MARNNFDCHWLTVLVMWRVHVLYVWNKRWLKPVQEHASEFSCLKREKPVNVLRIDRCTVAAPDKQGDFNLPPTKLDEWNPENLNYVVSKSHLLFEGSMFILFGFHVSGSGYLFVWGRQHVEFDRRGVILEREKGVNLEREKTCHFGTVHCVALWTRTLSQVWTRVKYVPKQSIA